MCGPHEVSDIIFGSVKHFSWQSFSTPLYHKLSVELLFFAHVTFASIESTFSYPHKEKKNYYPAPRQVQAAPQTARVDQPRAGL